VDSLTWPQAQELLAYWKKQPPTHILVKSLFSTSDDRPTEPGEDWSEAKVDELMAMFGGTGGQVNVVSGG